MLLPAIFGTSPNKKAAAIRVQRITISLLDGRMSPVKYGGRSAISALLLEI